MSLSIRIQWEDCRIESTTKKKLEIDLHPVYENTLVLETYTLGKIL